MNSSPHLTRKNASFNRHDLHDPVTWYKITYTGEQVAQWDFQNNAPAFGLEVPLCNLLTSIFNFVLCDWVVVKGPMFCELRGTDIQVQNIQISKYKYLIIFFKSNGGNCVNFRTVFLQHAGTFENWGISLGHCPVLAGSYSVSSRV